MLRRKRIITLSCNVMVKLCCICVTLAARLIGIFDLSVSILAISFVAAEFFADEKRLISFNGIETFMFTWLNPSIYLQLGLNRKWILSCMMVYSTLHFICSAGLVLATLTRKKALTVPWMTFELISLANQSSAVAVQFCKVFQWMYCREMAIKSAAEYLPLGSLYLLLCVYSWFIVFYAQELWSAESSKISCKPNESAEVSGHPIDLNSPEKSVLVPADHSIFESPEPPVPSKFYQL